MHRCRALAACGLVNRVVALDEIDDSVKQLAADAAANGPLAVRLVKANMRPAR